MQPSKLLLSFMATISIAFAKAVRNPYMAESPKITPAADLTRAFARQASSGGNSHTYATITQDPGFVGWYIGQNNKAQFCDDGATWTGSGAFAKCCNTGSSCAQTTSCSAASKMVDDTGDIFTCPTGYQCGTVTVYSTYPRQTPMYNLICANSLWSAWTMYRDIPSTQPTTLSSPSSSTPITTSTHTTIPGVSLPQTPSSKVWIAGAIVGPVAGLALLSGLFVFFLRRRYNAEKNADRPQLVGYGVQEKHTDYKSYPASPSSYVPNNTPHSVSSTIADPRHSMLSSAPPPSIMPSEVDSKPVYFSPVELPVDEKS